MQKMKSFSYSLIENLYCSHLNQNNHKELRKKQLNGNLLFSLHLYH